MSEGTTVFRFSQAYKKPHPEKRNMRGTLSDNKAVLDKIEEARRHADEYHNDEVKLESKMQPILLKIMELHEYVSQDEEAEAFVANLLNKSGVRFTKNTTNPFIPLVKLIPPKMPKSSVGRTASVLDYAYRNNIESSSLENFIVGKGGIVGCAKSAKASLKPERDQKSAERSDTNRDALRKDAKPFPKSAIADHLPDGLSRCLIEKRDGKVVVLSIRKETSASGYPPLTEVW